MRNLVFTPLLLIVAVALDSGISSGQISDPILPGITVEIADIVSFPDTRGQGAEDFRSAANIARINFMREVPGFRSEWLVHDLRGAIYRVNPSTQQVDEYLDMDDEFTHFTIGPSGFSTGLNSVALHPEFGTNGKLYTLHSESTSGNPATPDFGNPSSTQGHIVLTEWTATDPSANSFGGTKREILRVAKNARLHNLGDITFNPFAEPGDSDYGLMYVAGGDSGNSTEGQELDSIYGSLIRIHPTGNNSANGQYGIPANNPFATDNNANTLGEIYAYGFRNLHRIGWDLETGELVGTDVGDGAIEEINLIESGGNYGWRVFEGTFFRGGGTIPSETGGLDNFVWPAAQYDHGDGFAIAGGFVYRGSQIPQLQGKFVYGDIVNGRIFYSDFEEMVTAHEDGVFDTTADVFELFLTQDGNSVTLKDLITTARPDNTLPNNRTDLRFGQTSDGEIYLSTKQDGWIRQLVGEGIAGDFDQDGDVDGDDFLAWQRGESPISFSEVNLEDWQLNLGMASLAATIQVPEPTNMVLLCVAAVIGSTHGRRSR